VLQTLGANLEDQSADDPFHSMSPMSLRVIRSRSASDLKLTAVEAEGKRCEGKVKHGSSGSGFKFFNIKKTCTLKIGGMFSF